MLGIAESKFVLAALRACCAGAFIGAAQAAVLECPSAAPADWKLPKSRLDRAQVLAYLPTTRADERGLAEGLPEREWQVGGSLYQLWNMKAGRRGTLYQVNCLYTGTARSVRFDPRSTARCIGKRRLRDGALLAGAMAFRCH